MRACRRVQVRWLSRGAGATIAVVALSAGAVTGCGVNAALEQVAAARHTAAEILVQFTKAANASDRAVMADADAVATAAAGEAEQAKQAVQRDIDGRVKALVATAVARMREIQVLQAPHIADADDAVMSRMEVAMGTSEKAARQALADLTPLVAAGSRPRLAAAQAALDRFMGLHAEIIVLSRRNTNVRSLALALNEKQKVVTASEASLRALLDALTKRTLPSRAWGSTG